MVVVSLFDYTTNMVRPWAEAGYTCYCVDIQHPRGRTAGDPNIICIGADLRKPVYNLFSEIKNQSVACFLAGPPCTDVAVSGARWMKDKGLSALIDTLELFRVSVDLANEFGAPYLIENPKNTISSYWREPDHKFDPNDYGDPYTKETWLWTGNGFVMPPIIKPGDMFGEPTWVYPTEGSKMHMVAPGPERANIRSAAPMGFSRAVFEANSKVPA